MPQATGITEIEQVGALAPAPTVEIVSHHWKLGARVKVDPTRGYQALKAIYDQDRIITPAKVVTAATPKDAVLHGEFEWDDTTAARQHREEQARSLLRSAVVVYKRPDQTLTQPVRAFVKLVPSADNPALDAVSEDAVQPHTYLPIRAVMDEPSLREHHKRQAFRELATWRNRYREIADFAAVFEQIDRLAAQFEQSEQTG